MPEVSEQPAPTQPTEQPSTPEVKKEHRVVEKVKKGVNKAWDVIKNEHHEYWEIRHAMQERLAWHGGGVYKYFVNNMDNITNVVWGSKEPNFGKKIMEVSAKVRARIEGAVLAGTSAAADIVYNIGSWPFRAFLPIPKDVFKRTATVLAGGAFAVRGAIVGEMGLNKGVKAVAEGVITAPEVIAKRTKKNVELIIDKIRHPKPPAPAKA